MHSSFYTNYVSNPEVCKKNSSLNFYKQTIELLERPLGAKRFKESLIVSQIPYLV